MECHWWVLNAAHLMFIQERPTGPTLQKVTPTLLVKDSWFIGESALLRTFPLQQGSLFASMSRKTGIWLMRLGIEIPRNQWSFGSAQINTTEQWWRSIWATYITAIPFQFAIQTSALLVLVGANTAYASWRQVSRPILRAFRMQWGCFIDRVGVCCESVFSPKKHTPRCNKVYATY